MADTKTHRGICRVKVLVFPDSLLSEQSKIEAELNGKPLHLKSSGEVTLLEHVGVWPANTRRHLFVSDPIEVFDTEYKLLIAPVESKKHKMTSPEVLQDAWIRRVGKRTSPRGEKPNVKNWDFESNELPIDYVNWFTALENFRFTMENLRRMVTCAGVLKGNVDVDESLPDPTAEGKKCLIIGDVNTPITILLELC